MITPQRRTIEQILNESRQYAIPGYQRDFEWKRENAEEFWNDLDGGSFYLGTIIFDIYNRDSVSVVDGQQRLTTIFILLAAMRERAKNIGNENFARAIQDKIVFLGRTGEVQQSKLIPAEKIKFVFEQTITSSSWNGNDFSFRSRKRQVNKIKPIYEFFKSKLALFDKDELSSLQNRLYDSFAVVIEIEHTEEAFDIFERTNARGIDLNAADLLKNHLFSKMSKESNDELRAIWDTIIERSNGNTLRMIKYFYVSKSGYVSKKDLFKKIKLRGESIGPEALLKEIDVFSKHYSIIVGGTKSAVIEWADEFNVSELQKEYYAERLNRSFDGISLFSVAQSYPLLVKVMDLVSNIENESDRNSAAKELIYFVELIENFHFINSAVTQKQANTVESFYAEVCTSEIKPEEVTGFMKLVINNLSTQKLATKEEFIASFMNLNYENDFILTYYISDRLNNHYLDDSNQQIIYNPDRKILKRNYSIDHLISQSGKNYNVEIDEDLIHNIGNLLVIPVHLNSRLGNVHIEEKIAVLCEETMTLPEVKTIVDEWEGMNWDSLENIQTNILERARKIAEQCYDDVFKIS